MKPVDLLSELILNSSHVDGIVLDPFAGSGSAGVAAAACGRRAVLIEKEPAYGKVCVDRLVDATGLDAVKVS